MRQSQAWSGDRPADSEAARERLIEAAARCIQLYGVDKTGISDVAREAGVTRRTVYRYFEDRQVLVSSALVHSVEEFAERARALLDSFDDPAEMVVEGISFALRELPNDPVLGRALRTGQLLLNAESLAQAQGVLAPLIEPITRAAGWTAEQRDECGELILRAALSLLASPRPEDLRGFLERRIVPALSFA